MSDPDDEIQLGVVSDSPFEVKITQVGGDTSSLAELGAQLRKHFGNDAIVNLDEVRGGAPDGLQLYLYANLGVASVAALLRAWAKIRTADALWATSQRRMVRVTDSQHRPTIIEGPDNEFTRNLIEETFDRVFDVPPPPPPPDPGPQDG